MEKFLRADTPDFLQISVNIIPVMIFGKFRHRVSRQPPLLSWQWISSLGEGLSLNDFLDISFGHRLLTTTQLSQYES
jgi:hypothetical protein